MPKQRITKEAVLSAAYGIARDEGAEGVVVKSIAKKLSCSVQPIYTYCENMDALKAELAAMAGQELAAFVSAHVDKADVFRSTGAAYLAFAKEQPHLFNLYFSRKRKQAESFDEIYALEASPHMAKIIAQSLDISEADAKSMHMNMIIYNMGLSFIITNGGKDIKAKELNTMLSGAYNAFLSQIKGK